MSYVLLIGTSSCLAFHCRQKSKQSNFGLFQVMYQEQVHVSRCPCRQESEQSNVGLFQVMT